MKCFGITGAHVKDPKKKIICIWPPTPAHLKVIEEVPITGTSPEAKIWVKNFHSERMYIFKDLRHILTIKKNK